MDTELLKTFLEVQRTRHFGKAAENLFLCQSAVSARIRQLEEMLGTPLFQRQRNNIQLTPAGQRLLAHAERILSAWQRARLDVVADESGIPALAIGGAPSAWDIFLQDWLSWLDGSDAGANISLEVLPQDTLVQRVVQGNLDLAFLFDAPHLNELWCEKLITVPLVLVCREANADLQEALSDNYILVDWGTRFATEHSQLFPQGPIPRWRIGLGRLALQMLLDRGGAAYMALPMVQPYIERGELYYVDGAPVIERDAYGVFALANTQRPRLEAMLGYFKTDFGATLTTLHRSRL